MQADVQLHINSVIRRTVCGNEKDPLRKYRYFQHSSVFLHNICRDYL